MDAKQVYTDGMMDRLSVGAHRVIDVVFPCEVKQVDRNKVQITVEPGPEPFSPEWTKHVVDMIGEIGASAFLDDMGDYMNRQLIIRNIR
jgi:hypothetical protein